jgi:threonine dehydrogenase-like Zn-dependent dehydrogenase
VVGEINAACGRCPTCRAGNSRHCPARTVLGIVNRNGAYAGDLQLDASALVVDEITLVGSRCGPFAPALELLAGGKIDVRSLMEAGYSLSQGLKAFDHARRPGALKIFLKMA